MLCFESTLQDDIHWTSCYEIETAILHLRSELPPLKQWKNIWKSLNTFLKKGQNCHLFIFDRPAWGGPWKMTDGGPKPRCMASFMGRGPFHMHARTHYAVMRAHAYAIACTQNLFQRVLSLSKEKFRIVNSLERNLRYSGYTGWRQQKRSWELF